MPVNAEVIEPNVKIEEMKKKSLLAKKDLYRIDEAADYFGVTERCIRLWIDHGHLRKEKIIGTTRISRESILQCRFNRLIKPSII